MKARSVDKIPSGIHGFDEVSEGGFIKNSIISLSGDTGSGKTIFGMQFLYNGATQNDENGMYICFEEPKKIMYRNMLKLGWNLKALEESQKLIYLEYPPHEINLFFEQENTLINLIDKFAINRLVIDKATMLGLHFANQSERREGMLKMIDKLRGWGCTSILIGESESEMAGDIDSLADSVIRFYSPLQKGIRKHGIEIVEMRGSKHSMQVHSYMISSKGIEIDPESVLDISK